MEETKQSKDVIAGLGEIGRPILQLMSRHHNVIGYDIDTKLMNLKKFNKLESVETMFLHICIPYSDKFVQNVLDLCKKFRPHIVVIHSTIRPYTNKNITKKDTNSDNLQCNKGCS